MDQPDFDIDRYQGARCVSLIGMAGAGKSTVGKLLAARLGMAHIDTDRLIEATYGLDLQALLDAKGCEEFLRIEEEVVRGLGVRRCVVSTGGSVVYGPAAMARLKELGPVVFLDVDSRTFFARTGDLSGRGFIRRRPEQDPAEVFAERQPLYRHYADFTFDACGEAAACAEACAALVVDWYRANAKPKPETGATA